MDNKIITFTSTSVDSENKEYVSFSLDGEDSETVKSINLHFQFNLFLEKLGISAEVANTSYLEILHLFGTLEHYYNKVKENNKIDRLQMMEINSYEHFENVLLTDKSFRCFLYENLKDNL